MNKSEHLLRNISLFLITLFIIWFLLPIVRFYFSGGITNLIMAFILFFWAIIMFLLFKGKKIIYHKCLIFVLINILFYLFNFILRLNGNIGEFIKMGVMYFFPLFIFFAYYILKDRKALKYLFYLSIICIVITLIPTLIELIKDPTSLRWMAYYSSMNLDTQLIKRKFNIGDFSFIYGLIFLIPILYFMIFKKKKYKIIYLLLLVLVVITVFKASFSIAIILSLISLIVCIVNFYFNNKKINLIISYLIIVLISLVFLFPNILYYVSGLINNSFVSERINEIASFILNFNNLSGDLGSRMELYAISYNTFIKHFFTGIGGYYYALNIPIGYHSQILDDMARYGIFYFINTILFIVYYRKFLCKILIKKMQFIKTINIMLILYFILLLLNPVYLCAWVSTILFLVLPCSLLLEDD